VVRAAYSGTNQWHHPRTRFMSWLSMYCASVGVVSLSSTCHRADAGKERHDIAMVDA
jgi:hypothetical protein